ncbi:Metal tolerance protein 4 [Vitis vinifera]|uniref:Metal tolerance protein 4 n=2 Tax=Vitis vinifera TaxID=29760 RepID=A0A438ELL5_VITVI|nr:Metal tolerance protein 4 [Vitis vinifera]
MDGDSGSEPKSPLLSKSDGWRFSESRRRGRLSRRNSSNSLRNEFVSRLPEKIRSGIDVESPSHLDLSKSKGLSEGVVLCVCLSLLAEKPKEKGGKLSSKHLMFFAGEKEYYERQWATLKSFEEVDSLMTSNYIDEEDLVEQAEQAEQAQQEMAMRISNYANVVLLAFKIYATIKSGSIAIAASTLDSLLDLMAGGILWFTHLSMKNINIYQYPIGKLRVQPVGIIIFAAIMATLGFQILIEAVEELVKDKASDKMSSDQLIWLYTIMLSATAVKLALWLYCRTSRNKIVRAYANDHYFDVITNVVGLVAAVLGDKFYWWIDPVGAIFLAVYTITNWSQTVLENAVSLVGQSAAPEVLQKLTYLVIRHPQVKRIDTVRAYTFGVLYFVEVDIELPEDLPLKEAHTIGETLQIKIERLPEVERAFVHLDFECDHKPEHSILSRLPNSQP